MDEKPLQGLPADLDFNVKFNFVKTEIDKKAELFAFAHYLISQGLPLEEIKKFLDEAIVILNKKEVE